MGRLDANPDPQTPSQPPPQGYPNHHDNPVADNGHDMNLPQSTRSYVPQPAEQPPPEAYPPQKPTAYPPQQPPAAYPPQQPPAAYPPQPEPVAFPPPQPAPVAFPPPSPINQTSYTPQNYNYTSYNAQPQTVNYASPMKMGAPDGIAIGSQYHAPTQGWSTGLLDCFDDPENAIITACFPCVTFGQIAEIADNGQTSCATSGLLYGLISAFIGIPCIMSCSYRTKLRNRYGLMETPAPDWVTHFFCEWCALCQEYRELKARGMDPAIGWQGNMAKNQQMQQYYSAMAPPTNQTMMG